MSSTLEIVLDDATLERFPEVEVVAFAAEGLADAREGLERVAETLVGAARAAVADEFEDAAALVADPRIRDWRDAIRRCGQNASGVRSSAEQLARRLLRGDDVGSPDPLVRAYCAVSGRHLAPIGVYDLDRLPVPVVTLRPARPDDELEPLGGRAEDMPLDPKVIVYAAGSEVLCWAFNHRDSARTALRPATERALVVAESVGNPQRHAAWAATAELQRLLAAHDASTGALAVASAERPRAAVPSAASEELAAVAR